jgi:hypothetical protein
VKNAISLVGSLVVLALAACAVGTGDPFDPSTAQSSTPVEPSPSSSPGDADAAPAHADASVDASLPRDAAVFDASPASPADASTEAAADAGGSCADYAAPAVVAACHSCGSKPCQANGCYNGYWCDTLATKCLAKPAVCP